ncbi:tetratricopeptide repeat-containing sensor histidine kinase [Marinifilum sp. RC60d5]|uniref:tetratricopeptide repeat-containing sensor histidine kinase n=1 Tax=Marinifilum sp. RC60d5 TaxID=3458414 RepID=UPI004035B7EF
MKYCFVFTLIIFYSNSIFSQTKVDCLQNKLQDAKNENKAYIYNELAHEVFYTNSSLLYKYAKKTDSLAKLYNIDSTRISALNNLTYASVLQGKVKDATKYNQQAINLAFSKNLTNKKISSVYFKGFIFYATGQTDSSLFYLNKAYKSAITANHAKLKLQCLNTIASNFLSQGKYTIALEKFTKAYNIADSLKLSTKIINLSLNIGTTLMYNEEIDKAINYFEKVIVTSDTTITTLAYASALNNIGSCLNKKGNYKRALLYFNKSLTAFLKLNNKLHISQVYANLGQTNIFLNRTEAANGYLQHAVALNREGKSYGQLIVNLILLGDLQIRKKEYLQAKYSIDEAKSIIDKYNVNTNKIDLYKTYSSYFKATNQLNKALTYKELELQLRDSIFNENRQKQISQLETKFQTKLKENENESLRKDLSFNKLQVDKQTQLRNFFLILAILVIVLVMILLNRARLKKQAHKIIEEQKQELEKANRTKDKFFGIIAHDLRAPFNVLIVLSKLLYENYDDLSDKDRKSYINDLKEASKGSFNLVEDLLTWSRIQGGNPTIKKENLNIHSIVQSSISPLKASAKLKNITITNHLSSETTGFADKHSLETIIVNLINNALKFTPNNGEINISATSDSKNTTISISDTGIGMSRKQIDQLFKIDVNNSTLGTNKEKGTGLGLTLCKEFIEINNGKIWVESIQGKGSTFSFYIPTR